MSTTPPTTTPETSTAARPISNRTPLLDRIVVPADLRRLPEGDLKQVAEELRRDLIDSVSVTGGHLGAGLGVVELTVALHYVFETPKDRLIWDVGHQAYPHKILTGQAGPDADACARAGGFRASRGGRRASTTPLARRTARPRSRRVWGWRWGATSRAAGTR